MVLCPGAIVGNSAPCDRAPEKVRNSDRLVLQATCSTFTSDWALRLRATANINLFLIRETPLPRLARNARPFLGHNALRLDCNHVGYAPLWKEQIGDTWREPDKQPFTWPVLAGDEDRWAVRAAIDAVVADACGLSREQYAHVLSTFSHASYLKAPEMCLACFDELKAIGLDAFTKKHDPYWDIPLNENLPQPVIDLPVAEAEQSTVGDPALGPQFRLSDQPSRQRAKRKR